MFSSAPGLPLPHDFLFGASSSAHATEGGNTNSDWWHREHHAATTGAGPAEPSGDAADSYHRWRVDIGLLADLGFTDYRFGVEWARIEPAPGHFSRAALDHYRRMVDGANEEGVRPMVVLNHLTVPRWFAERGGWTAPDAADRFARYAGAAACVVRSDVRHVCTISEPNVTAVLGTLARPGPGLAYGGGLPLPDPRVTDTLVQAHRRATQAIKYVAPHVQIGWSVANQVCQAAPGAEGVADAYRRAREDVFLEAARGDDWTGVQAHTRAQIGPHGPLPLPVSAERTLTGWEFYPQALGEALRHTAQVVGDVPLIVTEHGIATDDDSRRTAYTAAGLDDLARALADGLDVRGYLHRSALDGYEWGSYRPTFGLIAVDRATHLRVPKPSAHWLGRIAGSRTLPYAPPRHRDRPGPSTTVVISPRADSSRPHREPAAPGCSPTPPVG
ncbi:glycoside hydrolase family 1 protein [Streptacidiphilus pinicola]|uniref:Glycoside hydrolase family 1 protein n=1 Tax=Streptacidiphilus pinicola TaxID=2219663 RepID=A0A2X0K886_9ACTN|nr:family 1 glycosylhydrolase [Streptacidiphilus pinicola]RAG85505.1 glycoside hydrolase family 1 protein [Streptacidiphilus pinicola]